MSDVREVFITKEVAEKLNLNPSYIIRLAKKINLTASEMREAGTRNYLFSETAIEKLRKAKTQK
ncbi:MAG: AraC family transcriptional regulator [Heliobacteriaceae bacterium]|nr:AraC family transcriptional regulator [Heliobacteriaceae bacterium]